MTEPTGTAGLRRRVYDAARTPATGGVFHLNGTGCHQGADATCPTDRLGHSVCPCTED